MFDLLPDLLLFHRDPSNRCLTWLHKTLFIIFYPTTFKSRVVSVFHTFPSFISPDTYEDSVYQNKILRSVLWNHVCPFVENS